MDSMTERDLRASRSNRDDGDDLPSSPGDGETKRVILAGLLGAVVASAGYLIYSRLEDEHKDALRRTVVKFVEDRISDVRANLKL